MMNTSNAEQNHGQNMSLHRHQFDSIESKALNPHLKFQNQQAEPLFLNYRIPVSTTTFLPQYLLPRGVLHQSRNSYYSHKPFMMYPPYCHNNTLTHDQLYLGWAPPRNYLTQVWTPPYYPSWQSAESFQYNTPTTHADVSSCPKIQAPVAPFPFSLQNRVPYVHPGSHTPDQAIITRTSSCIQLHESMTEVDSQNDVEEVQVGGSQDISAQTAPKSTSNNSGMDENLLSLIQLNSNAIDSCFPSRRRRLSNQERHSIYEALLKKSINGKLIWGSVKSVASMYHVSTRSIHRIWERASSSLEGQTYVDVSRRYFKSGCKKKHVEFDRVIDVPLCQRTSIRSLANALNISRSTVHRGIKEGRIRPNSNAIKPRLTDENKRSRVRFCMSMLETPCPCRQPTFKGMLDVVHVGEKWFYMSKESEKYYLHPNEVETHRACQSEHFISKVMFLAAVARPRFDHLRNKEFSGKIGIFPFVFKEPATSSSKNPVAGTLETKAIISVTKDVYRRCLIEKVLPAIRDKWPRCDGIQKIYIQQDNAKPHIDTMDDEFRNAASVGDFEMHLTVQPSNSPDMNVLDLGLFNTIQSSQHQEAPRTIDELVHAVEDSFNRLSSETINDVFLTLQASMIEVLKHNGGFDYKLPHLDKGRLKKLGTLPFQLQCPTNIVESASLQLQSTEISQWNGVSRWIICRDYVCVKHYIPADQDERNTRSNGSELRIET